MFSGLFVCLNHWCCVCGVTLTRNVTNLVVAGFWEQHLSLGVLLLGNEEDQENHEAPGDGPKKHVDGQNECCCVNNCWFALNCCCMPNFWCALNCIVIQIHEAKDIGIPDDGEHGRSCGIFR